MFYTKEDLKQLVYDVNGAAIDVHKNLGPGLLESVYHKCLSFELQNRGLNFKSEFKVQVMYKDVELETDLRCDLIVEDILVVELKAIDKVLPIHITQLMTYMKLLELPMGLMLNFNSYNLFNDGQKTYINEYFKRLI